MILSSETALNNSFQNRCSRSFPAKTDQRCVNNIIFPDVKPRFTLVPGTSVFTIGSCFARNIERRLHEFTIPTLNFSVPKSEFPHATNGQLNEYNPGTMYQRISNSISGTAFSTETILPQQDGYIDLLLHGGLPVSFKRACERRKEIDDVYTNLVTSDAVIITLGLIEAWYDTKIGLYLNCMPPISTLKAHPDRYVLKIIDPEEAYSLLKRSIVQLIGANIRKILLTVSPVPLNSTFSKYDCVIANCFSKSSLIVCANRLYNEFNEVDYFPSYEIVTSNGLHSYIEDNVHVSNDIIKSITDYMLEKYMTTP